jgi:hypothetical protein
MAVLEQQQGFILQVLHADRRALRERMVRRQCDHEGFIVELARLESIQIDGEREDTQVDLARAQLGEHRCRGIFIESQIKPRQRLSDFARDARQKIGSDRWQHRDAQCSGERIAMRTRKRDHFIARLENAPRTRHDLLAGGRQRHALGLAFDELHPKVLFEFLQLRRQGRLADEAALGCAAEVTRVGDGHEIAQILQFQVRHGGDGDS